MVERPKRALRPEAHYGKPTPKAINEGVVSKNYDCCAGVSVIVCTFNGTARIGAVLEALAVCDVSFPAEVILVDNNSTDGVANVAREVWAKLDSGFITFR